MKCSTWFLLSVFCALISVISGNALENKQTYQPQCQGTVCQTIHLDQAIEKRQAEKESTPTSSISHSPTPTQFAIYHDNQHCTFTDGVTKYHTLKDSTLYLCISSTSRHHATQAANTSSVHSQRHTTTEAAGHREENGRDNRPAHATATSITSTRAAVTTTKAATTTAIRPHPAVEPTHSSASHPSAGAHGNTIHTMTTSAATSVHTTTSAYHSVNEHTTAASTHTTERAHHPAIEHTTITPTTTTVSAHHGAIARTTASVHTTVSAHHGAIAHITASAHTTSLIRTTHAVTTHSSSSSSSSSSSPAHAPTHAQAPILNHAKAEENIHTTATDNGDNNDSNDSGSVSAPSPSPSPSSPPTVDQDPNVITAQSVESEAINAQRQNKTIGISIGAVVGCVAAAGLAGMFINRHRQNAQRNSDLEKHERSLRDSSNTEVNTRWRPQSFMVAVAGAVAKLPKRSASNASQNNATHSQSTRGVGSVLGSIRRVASNTSSIASWGSTRSHVSGSSQQSYGIAVTTPIPPLSRIDGMETSSDAVEAHYNSHNHAY